MKTVGNTFIKMVHVMYQYNYSVRQLWEGCLFASIAHAVTLARLPMISNEQSWDESVYSVQDTMGARGAVNFAFNATGFPMACAGAVFNLKCDRASLVAGRPKQPFLCFSGASDQCLALAKEAFLYLLDDFGSEQLPWITSGFWIEETVQSECLSCDLWQDFIDNGGFLFQSQFFAHPAVASHWAEHYGMSQIEIDMVEDLYQKKISNPRAWIGLTASQLATIGHYGNDLDESWKSFAELQISFFPRGTLHPEG